MFKRLRERIAEEATKFPVGQLNSNSGKQLSDSENKVAGGNSTEDLITLSDSSAVVVPHTSSQQFSIGEDEDGSVSEHSTPQRKNEPANGSVASSSRDHPAGTGSDLSFGQDYRPTKSNYIPQSDIESEREDPPTLNLEGISKDQLLSIIELLKARAYKYKNKYVEVVKNYKELREEKLKIENTLIEQQDKALRRMAELREQCQLEQKAKAHLEANLRLMLEEKDSRICVLETQINLLKENPDNLKAVFETNVQNSDMSSGDAISDSGSISCKDHSVFEEKLERFEHQLSQANKTITAQTDQISLLRKQNESLSQELEEKMKRFNEMEDEQGQLKSKHEFILQGMQSRLKELETQQEESVMSMAETKKNMHEELEFKEKQLVKAEEEAKQYQAAYEAEKSKVLELQKQQDEKINNLQHQLESTERMLEEEKQNLMQELARGKSAAITLVQQECAKKIAAVEEEWKIKLEDMQKEKGEVSEKKLTVVEQELMLQKQHVEQLNTIIEQLEKENGTLKTSLERLESEFTLTSTKLEKLQAEYSDLEELSQKKSLQYEEQLKQELNDKLQQQQSESEFHTLCESLKDQLNQNKNVIDDMVHNKNSLCDQIGILEKREKELTHENESLKNETKNISLKCENLTAQLEEFSNCEVHKKEEIQQLQEFLIEVQTNHQTVEKELMECKKELVECKNEISHLDSEKKELMSEVCLLKKSSEELKNKILVTENEVAFLNNVLNESSVEFGFLKECLDEKLKVVEDLVKDYASVDHCLISLEKQDHDLKSKIIQYETDCSEVWNKVAKISKIFKSMDLNKVNFDININIDESSAKNIDNSTLLINEYSSLPENEKTDTAENNKELPNIFKKTPVMSLKYDLNSCDVIYLRRIIDEYIDENQKLKENSELQNVEFAKYITQLHESLNELQEERNNLSLVLQSVETHVQDINPATEKNTKLAKNVEQGNFSCELNKQLNSKLNIMELNNKVKSEIAALSAQTEMINHELCSLREQFNFAQLTYSEKVLQLNSKLMRRTEQLLELKEDLDASLQNSKDLKCLLETVEKQLTEKNDLLKVSEKSKEELESKLKNLKDKFVQKEFSLKQIHNSQLSDLKDQTKVTIDKLNEEIHNLNAKFEKSIADYELKLSKVKEQCNQELNKAIEDKNELKGTVDKLIEENENINVKLKEIENDYELKFSNIKEQCNEEFNKKLEDKELLQRCENNMKEMFEVSKNFEFEFLSNLNKLDVYNSKICSLNSNFNSITLKLQEKDKSIAIQQCKINDLENQIKFLVQENEVLSEMKNKVTETSSLYESTVNKLENEIKQREMYESDVIVLKEKYESALKQLENIQHISKFENEKLNCMLVETSEELKTLKIKYAEIYSSLEKTTSELNDCKSDISLLTELREKYDLLLKDYECSIENLEKEKNSASEALRAVSEWKSLCNLMLINFNKFADKSYENLEKIVLKLNQYEINCKSLEPQFSRITALFKFQKNHISDLENKVNDLNEKLAEQIQNQNDIATSEIKIENLEQKLKEVIEDGESLKTQLINAESELKAALVENASNSSELKKTQSSLEDTSLKLQNAEERFKDETDKLSIIENVVIQWEEKYNSLMDDFKQVSNEFQSCTDDLKLSHCQLKEMNERISLMVPKDELTSCEQTYADKLKEMKSEMELLQETINRLTNSLMEKELEIKTIQNEKEKLDVDHDESFKCMKEKLENAEKNYITQMDELKSRILLLEEEKYSLKTEKLELFKNQEQLQKEENTIKFELKSKEDEISKLQQKLEAANKEQVSKIHNFQETMKDKENMILKLKANIESLKKENSERNEELKRKISILEEERENLMIQAQERVSNTEAKCREDIKALQEKNNKLLVENREIEKLNNKISQIDKQLCENQRIAESRETASRREISILKDQLTQAEEKISEAEQKKREIETELSGKVRKLEEENSSLLGKTNHFESLKAEKEELNEKLKQAEQQVTSVKILESERDKLNNENMKILEELKLLKSSQNDNEGLQEKIEALEISEKSVRSELEELKRSKEILENELAELRSSFEKEKDALKSEKEKLVKQINLLEKMSSDPQSNASKDYIAVIRGECETTIKAKEEEMETKLKHLVRDFCIQMDVKDNDCDKMISELLEKNQDLEERLVREHRKEIAELRQNLFEKECALDEMRDSYEEVLQEKEKKLKELQSTIKKLSESSNNNDVALISTESSDWDDTWAVPDESVDNSSPIPCNESCKDHLQQIESLQNEVIKCNSEIKELKVLLRLSPPESMVNSCRKDPSQSIPEPTEFEYLKNIIYEYMMGKEPVTLAKVIAAVLRFSDSQTQQVIRREEARHPMR
ncbi:golgin subfamily A member 4 [Nephila pilipes]|uniref:Golgin subfamily A member 4 n=1 Tax=Nephila pilipes TaxID=299642 RepID=A0A8X6MQH0_NEPPI|nr:golgin subfamily A member 4 [Nephila pilipes]